MSDFLVAIGLVFAIEGILFAALPGPVKRAMAHGATAIIIVHNHPSGDPTPSQADVKLTRELAEAGRHMKVMVHDHIIIGSQGRSSLRSLGLM